MRKLIIIFLALVMAACNTAAPATPSQQPVAAPPEPSQTAIVVVITATSGATEPPAAPAQPTYTELPTYTPFPSPTEAPTQAQQAAPTEAVAAPTQAPAASGGPVTIDDKLGGGWFVGMSRDRNDFSLRCQLNKQITFTVKTTSPDIKSVDLWYRFEDRDNGAIFEWVNYGRMIPDNTGGFTLAVQGDKVNPNFRRPNAWFDFQFVGYNPTGVVGRSEKIQQQVSYTYDCP